MAKTQYSEIERAQQNYLKDLTMDEYLGSYNYKTMRKLFALCGTGNKILDVSAAGMGSSAKF
ncbi:hypothetical protein HY989_00505 [Candidatus Micrarchaeota archaeon]|nr:hypothetical protein [Candidatus Micrarchaeota archaeon]